MNSLRDTPLDAPSAQPSIWNPSPRLTWMFCLVPARTVDGEYLVMTGWPVQLLPPHGPLVEEPLLGARGTEVQGEPTRVFTVELLTAIGLQTRRAKDKARPLQFIEAGVLDPDQFQGILACHGLLEKLRVFVRQFPRRMNFEMRDPVGSKESLRRWLTARPVGETLHRREGLGDRVLAIAATRRPAGERGK